ncbi:retinoblastoma-like protein 2 [Stegodyphus dumicola]|uniref:retinoblastoma-like protein 2 n=1 Tax=Stegodyphus dumicola TaxID=202533 RepID=UPI0015AB3C0D|nr:retinoblastoma-like protein 2 [Stegodyphus dumicola]
MSGLNVPSCEDVSLPRPPNSTTTCSSQLVSSPLAHPAVRRVTSERKNPQSPIGLSERFQSPTPSGMSSARRRLFATTSSTSSGHVTLTTPQPASNNVSAAETTVINNPIMSPGRNVTIILQQVQSDNGVTYLPAHITRSPVSQANQSITCMKPLTTTVVGTSSQTSVTSTQVKLVSSETSNKPKRTGSLGLFFRKVYHLAGVRLKELCDKLGILDDELRRKIWTCFEYSLMQHTDLMCDRHLDQLLMCAVYVICKVTKEDRSFQEIMKYYRLQPQAASHVYRSVLLVNKGNKKRRNSGNSDNSKDGSGSNSPVPSENSKSDANTDKEEKESKRTEQLSTIRSSSTLPVPLPSSQPPTPTKLAGTGNHFEFEERGDLINFYNKVYVPKIQRFAYKFSQTNNGLESPPLSPLPRLNANPLSPWRRVSNKHSVYIAPMTNTNFPPSPGKPLSCFFNKSPGKDLRAINNFVKMGEKKAVKRLLQDDSDNEVPPKQLSEDLTLRKIQNVITERQAGNDNGLPE